MNQATVTACGVVLAVTAAAAAACGGDEDGPVEPIVRSVRYVVVSADDGVRSRTFSGVVRAGSTTRLSFQVSGRVSAVDVTVGDRVTEGQAIASIDPTDVQLQIQQARATAAQARAQLTGATSTYDRTRSLYENQNASRAQLDNARAQRDVAQSSLAAAGQAIRQLERQVGYASLTAPAEGTISELSVEANELVQAGQVIGVLQVGEQLEVAVDLPASFINDIERGQSASIAISSVDTSCAGAVHEVGSPSQGSGVFPVTIRLDVHVEQVRSGMAAEVTFDIEAEEDSERAGHVLPAVAVGEDRDGRFVFVVERTGADRGVVHRTLVEVGELGTEGLEVLSGIEDGDLVVTAGVSRINDGLEVRVPAPEGEAAEQAEGAETEAAEEAEESGE